MRSLNKMIFIASFLFIIINFVVLFFSVSSVNGNLKIYLTKRNEVVIDSVSEIIRNYYDDKNKILENMVHIIETGIVYGAKDINLLIEYILKSYNFFDSIMLLDKSGKVVYCSSNIVNSIGFNYSTSKFFSIPQTTGTVYWSDSFISNETGKNSINIGLPSEHFVIVAFISLDVIKENVVKITNGKRVQVSILDRVGTYIVSIDEKNVEERTLNFDILKSLRSGYPISDEFHKLNPKKIISYKVIDKIKWIIVTEQDNESVFYIIKDILSGQFLLVIFVTVFLILILNIVMFIFRNSYDKIIVKMDEIASGKYDEDFREGYFVELNRVADIFNRMKNAVRDRELKLVKKEQVFKTFIENLPVGIGYGLLNGDVLYLNRKFTEVFGYDLNDFSTISEWSLLAYPDPLYREVSYKTWQDDIKMVLSNSKYKCPVRIYKIHSKSGKVLDVEISFSIVDMAMYVVFNDLTEIARISDELRLSKMYLDKIINAMPSKIVAVDKDMNIILQNKSAASLTDNPDSIITGSDIENRFKKYYFLGDTIRDSIKSGTPRMLQGQQMEDDKYNDVLVYPLDADSAVVRIDDVTDNVKFQEMMAQAEKMVTIGELAAGMAHEINNPLASIVQGVQNSLRRLSPDIEKNVNTASEIGVSLKLVNKYLEKRNILKYLNGISESGKKAAFIVSNMLNFSRKTGGELFDENINEIVDLSIEMAENEFNLVNNSDFKQINIVKHYDKNIRTVPMRKTEIQQVLLNLIKNAAHSLYEKMKWQNKNGFKPEIVISTKDSKDGIFIEVKDNGCGMTDEVKRRLFEPFFTTKKVGLGTGIGLTVSYFIITENYKGKIIVDSKEGEWAFFRIYIPG